jgi:hypothetical protein
LDEITYGDEMNLTPQEFYNKMRTGLMPTTIASNPEVIRRTFKLYRPGEGHFAYQFFFRLKRRLEQCGHRGAGDL